MPQAKNGDTVKVHYTGKLDDGTVFDSSISREPLEFKLGEDQLIPGFEKAVVGMDDGDSKTVRIVSKLDHADPTLGGCDCDPTKTALDHGELNRLADSPLFVLRGGHA